VVLVQHVATDGSVALSLPAGAAFSALGTKQNTPAGLRQAFINESLSTSTKSTIGRRGRGLSVGSAGVTNTGGRGLARGGSMTDVRARRRRLSREDSAAGAQMQRNIKASADSDIAAATRRLKRAEARIEKVFSGGEVLYKGYTPDARNTDNAWVESLVENFHDNRGDKFAQYKLTVRGQQVAADLGNNDQNSYSAMNLTWVDASSTILLPRQHRYFLKLAVTQHNAHW